MDRVKESVKRLKAAFGDRVALRDHGHYVRLEGSLRVWEDVVRAGSIAAKALKKRKSVVNAIVCEELPAPKPQEPAVRDLVLDNTRPDVLIIGGGVVGCAIARELSRYKLDILLAEKEYDVALHASSRNDGMVHPGIDLRRGSLKHTYNHLGNRMYDDLCRELGVPFNRCGQYLCFPGRRWLPALYGSLVYWAWQGLRGVKVLRKKALRQAEPALDPKLTSALFFPSAGSVCPYGMTIALAENAAENGAKISLNTVVEGMEVSGGVIQSVATNRGTLRPKVVVNAAGVYSDEVAAYANDQFFSIHPRRGTNALLDSKVSDSLTNSIVASYGMSETKTTHSKGGGIVRTAEGNILVGPDAVETPEKEDFSTTRISIENVFAKHRRTVPALSERAVITYFTGVRAPTYEEDFIIQTGISTRNIVHAAGIQSPGLTAAPAIAKEIARLVTSYLREQSGAAVPANESFNPVRKPIVKTAHLPDHEREGLIQKNPDYGVIVCRCEEVSAGEVRDALRRPVPCATADGVKRRVRPGMGRCQGGFCSPLVARIIASETGLPLESVMKSAEGSAVVVGGVKEVLP
ncbi:MAG: NAD(P)/FAD-dependent oxidoreductase [Oscillospiraceae bacterium]|nr:NAD(P)/FAD-dependent oxidoreductase [Oscillospiraceae bacterium]